MAIQRWDESWYGEDYGGMKRSEAGFYVRYSDHVAAMFYATALADHLERDRIRQAVRALATERELNSPSEIPVDLWEILSIIDGDSNHTSITEQDLIIDGGE